MAELRVGTEGDVLPHIERRRGKRPSQVHQVLRDLIAGAVVSLVMTSYSLSFALLIFSGPLAGYLSLGVTMTIITIVICGVMVALTGSLRVAIVGPDTATMAVFSALAAGVAAHFTPGQDDMMIAHVMAALTLGSLITGVVLYVLGAMHAGVWIRYIPYPVLGGFLASVGWLLTSGAIKVTTGYGLNLNDLPHLLQADPLAKLAVGIAFTALIILARSRTRHDLVLPGLLVGGFAVAHLIVYFSGVSLAEARAAGWFLPRLETDGVWMPLTSDVWFHLNATALLSQAGEVAAALAVTAMAILLNGTGLEVWRKTELDLDRDLRAHGLAGMVSSLAGGTIGNVALNRTILNYGAGGRTRLSGVAMGLICLALLFAGTELIGYFPTPVLGGLLIFLGLGVLNNWLIRTWKRVSHADYVLILAILFLIVQRGYLEGIALGVIASCIFFALNYSRVRIIKHNMTREEYGSYVERSHEQTQTLRKYGNEIQILWLQGYLFFGSANRLLEEAKVRVDAPGNFPVRYVVLDFRLVAGIDSSAVFSFIKLRNFAAERNVVLIFCGMTPAMVAAFRVEGMFAASDPSAKLQPNLDLALESAEDAVLARRQADIAAEPAFEQWLARELGGEENARSFMAFVDPLDLDRGAHLFRQGEQADALYFVLAGRVSVILERGGSDDIRLRSMIGYTVVGEMGLYRTATRAASVIAEEPTRAYRLSRASMTRMEEEEPRVASAFHAFIVRTLADRLNFANFEIGALQR